MKVYSPKQLVCQINYLKNNSTFSYYQGRRRKKYLIPDTKDYKELIRLREELFRVLEGDKCE